MPSYPVKNLKTGEQQTLMMSMKSYDQWRKDNPDWDKDWSQGCAGAVSGTGDVYSKTDGGWNEVLHKVSKTPGSKVKPQKTTHF
tara:strand:- start:9660 stop:9911 length:252 start_codon:yes stop_codon:yes gene_type:complete